MVGKAREVEGLIWNSETCYRRDCYIFASVYLWLYQKQTSVDPREQGIP